MKFIDAHKDRWHTLGGEDGPPVSINPEPWRLLDLAQWHAARAAWPVDVPVGLKLANDIDVDAFCANYPLQRAGRAEDVARAIMFLASDAASYITGETLTVEDRRAAVHIGGEDRHLLAIGLR